jgi:hypothetical protein
MSKANRPTALAAGLGLLTVRGACLWALVPAAVFAWLLVGLGLRRRGIRLAQFIGWADLNMITVLQRAGLQGPGRPPNRWVPWSEMDKVTHRVGILDPL